MKKSLVALAYSLRRPKNHGHNKIVFFLNSLTVKKTPFGEFFFIDTLTMFLYTWDNRKEDMSKYNGLWFFYDDDISIYWNRSHTFNVWNNGKEVNCFTVMETMTPKQAEQNADEWLADVLQEEKLRHADAF